MGQEAIRYIFLCHLGTALVSLLVAGLARYHSRHKGFNLLIHYWISCILVFLYSALFYQTPIEIASSYLLHFFSLNILVQIVARSQGREFNWRLTSFYQILSLLLTGLLLQYTDVGFTLSLLPAALINAFPLFREAWLILVTMKSKSLWPEKAMGYLLVALAAHNIDYPFLRMAPEMIIWGYSLSLVLFQCVSFFIPSVINLQREENEKRNIKEALGRISGNTYPSELQIEELYQNLTLQISQKETFYRELLDANSNLREEKQINELLIRTMTHDLSGPLTAISAYTDLIHSKRLAESEYEEVWQRIRQNIQTSHSKIASIKSAIMARQIAAETLVRPVSLDQSMTKLFQIFEAPLKDKEIQLTYHNHFSHDVQVEAAEKVLVEQVLSRVLSNAIKYSYRGGKIHVTITDGSDGHLTIAFRDYGLGMVQSTKEIGLLFSIPGTEKETGDGFGLIIVSYFLRRFGGSYHLNAHGDKAGVTVSLKLKKSFSAVGVTAKPSVPLPLNSADKS